MMEPLESVAVEVAGGRLAVQVLGPPSGETALLVAGGAGEASAWRFLVPELRRLARSRKDHCGRSLAEELRVAVYDQRGVGGSVSLAPLLSTLSAAVDALAVGRAVHGEPFHLVGISLGGMVALELAAQHPEALASLTLLATSAGGVGLTPPDPAFLANVLGQGETDPAARLRENIALSLSPRFPEQYPDVFADLIADASEAAEVSEASWEALLSVYASHDVSERLARITVPTLVIGGQHDRVIPVPNAHYLAQHIPSARLLVLPTGHALDLEAPGRLIDEITDHITANALAR